MTVPTETVRCPLRDHDWERGPESAPGIDLCEPCVQILEGLTDGAEVFEWVERDLLHIRDPQARTLRVLGRLTATHKHISDVQRGGGQG